MFSIFLPTLSYASTYYRFKYFFSFLKKRHPQIVADIPHRVNKNKPLPVLLIVKNSDVYKAAIEEICIILDDKIIKKQKLNIQPDCDYWDSVFKLEVSEYSDGYHQINIQVSYTIGKHSFSCFNDNYRSTSHKPIPCYFSSDDLPGFPGYLKTETHSHSNYTNDQIEFGASIGASLELGKAIGLDCICITDHSYDLDDLPDNFLINDPDLSKWKDFRKTVAELNQTNPEMLIIPGEEVSVRNKDKETVHMLVYNSDRYFEGSGDSGEKWFKYFSQYHISEVTSLLPDNALAFAAHPTETIPTTHKFLLNRNEWNVEDARDKNLTGVQIINGHGEDKLAKAIQFWKSLLLQGYKKYALAGNDAHGNYGRNRSIQIPFISISETYTQIFGNWRTDVFLGKKDRSVKNFIQALKNGNYSMSNGPALDMKIINNDNTEYTSGSTVSNPHSILLKAKSTKEFGQLEKYYIYHGDIKNSQEVVYKSGTCTDIYELEIKVPIESISQKGYFRAEIQSRGPKGHHFAFTNPIWIEPDL
ncbi:MAG: CehA/McbA family metallohydrolase [Calditrichae bacterium]|nr:CehA/McbA family metallohydrolase [Calditrichota bacterium]MCB9058701.1 CehA/McbA family metallohydrolase [Calditrichia bacterium]